MLENFTFLKTSVCKDLMLTEQEQWNIIQYMQPTPVTHFIPPNKMNLLG